MFIARCVCGHSLEIDPQRLGRHVVCPMCNRTLIVISASPAMENSAAPVAATPAALQQPCPSCGEMILKVARKCRHCGEFVATQPQHPTPTNTAGTDSDPAEQPMNDAVFDVSASQWDNFWRYLTCLIILTIAIGGANKVPALRPYSGMIFAVVLTAAVFAAFLAYLSSRNRRCLINADRVETRNGIFTRQIDWISMSSILDIKLRQGVIQRILGIGSIEIRSNDQITPLLEIQQIPQARKVFEYLQQQISRRHQQGVARLI